MTDPSHGGSTRDARPARARFGYDLEATFRHVQAREARSGLTYVPCPPRSSEAAASESRARGDVPSTQPHPRDRCSDTSRPLKRPASGRIAVKAINHLGDEVMKVFRV